METVHRTRAVTGRTASSRIGLPVLGSAAAHTGLLAALLILGGASEPRGGDAVHVLLVGGAVSVPSGASDRGYVPSARAPGPEARPAAAEKPVPGSAAPPLPALPASAPGTDQPVVEGVSGRNSDPPRVVGASAGAEDDGSVAGEAPGPGSAHAGDGPGRSEPGSAGHVRASGGGFAGSGDSAGLVALRARIEERIVYPAEAVRRGQEGEVLLHIRIGREGIPQEIRIARSSGARVLDEAARDGVERASPLPSRPGWVEVPVRFFLR